MAYEKKNLTSWDLAKKAAGCPTPHEARMILGLNDKQFSILIGISTAKYWRWVSGESEPSIAEKILIKKCIEIAKEKGFIKDSDQ